MFNLVTSTVRERSAILCPPICKRAEDTEIEWLQLVSRVGGQDVEMYVVSKSILAHLLGHMRAVAVKDEEHRLLIAACSLTSLRHE